MKILVIDDDPDIFEVVSLTFEMRWPDSNIISAEDGETGIEMVDTESPGLVILDIGLPDMDGFTVCQEIRRFSDVQLFKWLNRRSQRHSYSWEQYIQALAWVGWPLVRRVHDLSPLARSRP